MRFTQKDHHAWAKFFSPAGEELGLDELLACLHDLPDWKDKSGKLVLDAINRGLMELTQIHWARIVGYGEPGTIWAPKINIQLTAEGKKVWNQFRAEV